MLSLSVEKNDILKIDVKGNPVQNRWIKLYSQQLRRNMYRLKYNNAATELILESRCTILFILKPILENPNGNPDVIILLNPKRISLISRFCMLLRNRQVQCTMQVQIKNAWGIPPGTRTAKMASASTCYKLIQVTKTKL